MNDLKACRICLGYKVKTYHMEMFELKSYYEEIMNCMIAEDDHLLQFFCYQCCALLLKYHTFKNLCVKSQEVQRAIFMQNWDVPLEDVIVSEKHKNNLFLPISNMIMTKRLGMFQFVENQDKDLDVLVFSKDIAKNDVSLIEEDDKIIADEKDYDFDCHASVCFNDDHNLSKENHAICTDLNSFKNNVSNELKTRKNKSKRNKESLKKVGKCDESYNHDVEESYSKSEINSSVENLPKKYKEKEKKEKFAKQKASGYKFDPNKWNVITLSEEEVFREFSLRTTKPSYNNFEYNCTKCLKGFSSQDKLDRHMPVHSETRGKHECYLCKRRFNWEGKLRAHLKTHQVRYHCRRCPEICLTSYQAKAHERFHDGVTFTCKLCDANFIKASTYYTHVRMSHRSQHVCRRCGASFVSENGLNQHTNYFHKDENPSVSRDKKETSTEIYCDKCDITFESKTAYEVHVRNSTLHIDECESNATGNKPKLLKPGRETRKPMPATCDQCGEYFATERACTTHKKRLHGMSEHSAGRYICEICGASLAPCSIFQHQNSHTGARVYPCATCGKVFKTPANRLRHLVTHTGEKRFACRLCDKRFSQRTSVKLHMKTYHQKQPYPARDRRRKKTELKHDQVQLS